MLNLGFRVSEPKAFASFNRVNGVNYDAGNNCYYKVYATDTEALPLQMMMRKRDPYHYLNVSARCKEISQSFKPHE